MADNSNSKAFKQTLMYASMAVEEASDRQMRAALVLAEIAREEKESAEAESSSSSSEDEKPEKGHVKVLAGKFGEDEGEGGAHEGKGGAHEGKASGGKVERGQGKMVKGITDKFQEGEGEGETTPDEGKKFRIKKGGEGAVVEGEGKRSKKGKSEGGEGREGEDTSSSSSTESEGEGEGEKREGKKTKGIVDKFGDMERQGVSEGKVEKTGKKWTRPKDETAEDQDEVHKGSEGTAGEGATTGGEVGVGAGAGDKTVEVQGASKSRAWPPRRGTPLQAAAVETEEAADEGAQGRAWPPKRPSTFRTAGAPTPAVVEPELYDDEGDLEGASKTRAWPPRRPSTFRTRPVEQTPLIDEDWIEEEEKILGNVRGLADMWNAEGEEEARVMSERERERLERREEREKLKEMAEAELKDSIDGLFDSLNNLFAVTFKANVGPISWGKYFF